MIFFEGIAEFPEDPFGIKLFAGTGKNDFHRVMMSPGQEASPVRLFFTDL